MRRLGLIGYPLGHSMSAQYFSEKFAKERLTNYSYELFPVADIRDLPTFLDANRDIIGLNVTIPHKTSVLEFVDIQDDIVMEINAANVLTVKYVDNKRIISAYNTDVLGIDGTLSSFLTSSVKDTLILGTGGAAKAVAFVLRKYNIHYSFVSRTPHNEILGYNDLDRNLFSKIDLIVNTTPLGMFPDVLSKPPLDYSQVNKHTILFDAVYNPERTAFLKEGEAIGCRIISGLRMFHLQAENSWWLFNT